MSARNFLFGKQYRKVIQPGPLWDHDIVGFCMVVFHLQQFDEVITAAGRKKRFIAGRPSDRLEPRIDR